MSSADGHVDGRRSRHLGTKAHILDVAWALADETGIAGLSLRELARRVGMRAPSLYTYFDSKDALFDAMFVQGYLELSEAQRGWAEEAEGLEPEEALAKGLTQWMGFCRHSIARYQLMFTRAIPGWEPSPEAYAVSVSQYEAMAVILASMGVDDDETRALFMAVSAGLVAQQLANDPSGDDWAALAPAAARMLLQRRRDS
jgi:AcrR family transcriptional regulator